MALLDARALAHTLAVEPSVDEALPAYAKMRRLHVQVFQALSLAFTPFYQSDSTALPFIRDRLVPTMALIPPGPRFLASMVAGTVIDPFGPIGLTETDWHGLSKG
jgi:2-polyprenyl-6-methoxyphenol hydroxylase-like FAD-dependent oxidoreductase